jgi:two-component sensor histidine kinase
VLGDDQKPAGVLAIVVETTGRVTAERLFAEQSAATREAHKRLSALVDATADIIYRMSPDWREMQVLEGRGFLRDTATPSIAWIDEYLFVEDQPAILEVIDEAVRNKHAFQLEHRVRQTDGSVGWTFSRAIPLLDEAGEISEWFGAASDVTARKQAEEHLRLVINELNHRVKNTLALTQAMATQSFRDTDDLKAAEQKFIARLKALASATDLMTGRNWVDASLRTTIEGAIWPYRRDEHQRCDIAGPEVGLTPKTAISLSMAIHELAANATKYGAWAGPAGTVAISWTVTGNHDAARLKLEWRESGGPEVSPPTRRGFGSRLIERGLAAEMGGIVRIIFEPAGVVCVIDAPLKQDV